MDDSVCFVVNTLGPGTSPATEATAVDTYTNYDATILVWFDRKDSPVGDNVPVHCLNAQGHGLQPRTLRRARKIIAAHDVVHTYEPHSAFLAKSLAVSAGIPSVFSAMTVYDRYTLKGRVTNSLTNAFAGAVTYVSPTVRDSVSPVERLLNRPDYVVYNGVDVDLVKRSIETGGSFETDRPLVAAAGRLIPEKGYDALVAAVADLDVQLLIAGGGPEYEALQDAAGENVMLLGELDREEAIRLMYDADVFVQPSLQEGFATSTLEAMVAGTPCVLSTIDAFTEPFPREAAFWTPPLDSDGIANAIEEALDDDGTVAETARALVEERYTLQTTAEQFAEIYDEIR